MTDERMGEALWEALERLPRGSGVVFRHYATSARRALFERVRCVARRRRLVLVLAGPPALAIGWRADGAHGPSPHRRSARRLVRTRPCHDRAELIAGRGADLRFVSPIFATRSHPGARALGRTGAGLLIQGERRGLIALGGMTGPLDGLGFFGWAAIDAWSR